MEQLNLKRETLITASEYMEAFTTGVNKVVQLFREGEEKKALEYMQDILEGLQWLHDALNLTKDIQTHDIEVQAINPFLKEMYSALENEDYTLIADLLEFEIFPLVYQWHAKIKQIIKIGFETH